MGTVTRDEALHALAGVIEELGKALEPWERDGLAALVDQYVKTNPRVARDRTEHGYVR
jgi:hypothetical protein